MILTIRAPDWGPDNYQEKQYFPLSPDVAQGQVYGETCSNLTVPWYPGEGHPKDATNITTKVIL